MDDRNLTLLSAEQALNLGVIKKYGAAAATDGKRQQPCRQDPLPRGNKGSK